MTVGVHVTVKARCVTISFAPQRSLYMWHGNYWVTASLVAQHHCAAVSAVGFESKVTTVRRYSCNDVHKMLIRPRFKVVSPKDYVITSRKAPGGARVLNERTIVGVII